MDIDKVNEVIDFSTDSGANRIGGVSFDIEDKEKLQNEARKEAVEQAKRKAKQAADTAGFRLGRMINYSENLGGWPVQPFYGRALASDALTESAPTEIQTGEQEITISVTLSYQIE